MMQRLHEITILKVLLGKSAFVCIIEGIIINQSMSYLNLSRETRVVEEVKHLFRKREAI